MDDRLPQKAPLTFPLKLRAICIVIALCQISSILTPPYCVARLDSEEVPGGGAFSKVRQFLGLIRLKSGATVAPNIFILKDLLSTVQYLDTSNNYCTLSLRHYY